MRPSAEFSRDWVQGNKERREKKEVERKIKSSRTVIGEILLEIKTGHSSSCKELFFLFIVDNGVGSKISKCRVSFLCNTRRIIRMCMLCRRCICLTLNSEKYEKEYEKGSILIQRWPILLHLGVKTRT